MIVTLSVFDLSDLTRKYEGKAQAGTRSTFVIAAADGAKENPENFFTIWNKLKPWELEREMILVADQKLGNIGFGKQVSHPDFWHMMEERSGAAPGTTARPCPPGPRMPRPPPPSRWEAA